MEALLVIRSSWRSLIGAAICIVWWSAGLAQTPPRADPFEPPSAPQGPPAAIELKLDAVPQQERPIGGTALIKAFRISGTSALSEPELAALLAPWAGRELNGEQLVQAAAAVTRYMRERGFLVAQAFVPAQVAQDGIVTIEVLEGRIGSVRLEMSGDSGLRSAIAERFLGGLKSDEVIRRENLEHSLLLLNDLPGARLQATIESTPRTGIADIRVRVVNDGKPVVATIRLDNAGQRITGEARASADVRFRGPLGIGDLLTVQHRRSSAGGETLSSVVYGLPVNGLGTRVGLRLGRQDYVLRKQFAGLDARGDQHAYTVLASHPLIRRSDHNLTLLASHAKASYVDRLGVFDLTSRVEHRVTAFGIAFDNRDQWLGGGANQIQIQRLGGRARQSDPFYLALDSGAGGLDVYGRFSVVRFRALREQRIGPSTSLLAQVSGQSASRNLDAGLELSLGGPDAVRGYPAGEVFADAGWLARVELRRSFELGESRSAALAVFVDQARARINRNPVAGDATNVRGLGAVGVGAAFWSQNDFRLQTWVAWRTSEAPATAPDRSPRVWLALSKSFH